MSSVSEIQKSVGGRSEMMMCLRLSDKFARAIQGEGLTILMDWRKFNTIFTVIIRDIQDYPEFDNTDLQIMLQRQMQNNRK